MNVWIAEGAAALLALLSLRSMAYAFGASLGPAPQESDLSFNQGSSITYEPHTRYPTQAWMLLIEISFSIATTLMIVGLAFAAALDSQLFIGALMAQAVVVGALIAPPVSFKLGTVSVRPAAIALGLAQLILLVFFIQAMQALLP